MLVCGTGSDWRVGGEKEDRCAVERRGFDQDGQESEIRLPRDEISSTEIALFELCPAGTPEFKRAQALVKQLS
jgi:hypothetical protein